MLYALFWCITALGTCQPAVRDRIFNSPEECASMKRFLERNPAWSSPKAKYRGHFVCVQRPSWSPVPEPVSPALASGTIGYGSRAGMEVSVLSVSGLNSAHAVIRTKHTRQNAIAFCRDYVQKVTEDCIREELSTPLNDVITANCLTNEFVDFLGNRYRFLGPAGTTNEFDLAKYVLMDLATGKIADGSSASGYPTNMAIFRALCPAHAPIDE